MNLANNNLQPQIYWANSLFTQADRDFNLKGAELLRSAGFTVFLPQEAGVNINALDPSPNARDIFRVDTKAVLCSKLLVACLDQETIDCGVACEIGIALSHGIPVIGLYTDVRQHRTGAGRMYKNLYILGAIELIGEIVESLEDLPIAIARNLSESDFGLESEVSSHFDRVAVGFPAFIKRLESWYQPSWNVFQVVDRFLPSRLSIGVLDIGSGSGQLCANISEKYTQARVLGFDKSVEMVRLANEQYGKITCKFTSDWSVVLRYANDEPFDIALLCFTLHDHTDPVATVRSLTKCLRPGGRIIIVDLSSWDLPSLVGLLRSQAIVPVHQHEPRITPIGLSRIASLTSTQIESFEVAVPKVHFPSAAAIDEYLEFFGIYLGMDLPLRFSRLGNDGKNFIQQTLKQQIYPFIDQRSFAICVLRNP